MADSSPVKSTTKIGGQIHFARFWGTPVKWVPYFTGQAFNPGTIFRSYPRGIGFAPVEWVLDLTG